MAIDSKAIARAIRNLMNGELRSVRSIGVETFHEGSDQEEANQALAKTLPTFRIIFGDITDSPASSMSNTSSRAIRVIGITIILTHAMPSVVEDDEDAQSIALNDADLVLKAIQWPGNLSYDGEFAPFPTGIVAGLLVGPGGEGRPSVTRETNIDALTITTTISASAIVVVHQEIAA